LKILLDECAPKRLRALIAGHDVVTVPDAGWAGLKNGELMRRAAASFDVFLTVDRNLAFQQNPSSLPIPVVVLISGSTKFEDLAPLIPKFLQLLQSELKPGIYHLGANA
jgi:predicted nuclease of predicted toxin-antitoxin system